MKSNKHIKSLFTLIGSSLFCVLLMTGTFHDLCAQEPLLTEDSLSTKQYRKYQRNLHRKDWRKQTHQLHDRFFLSGSYTFSSLLTTLSFKPPDDFITVTFRMESDLQLQESDEFFTGYFLGRITPRSSIYGSYYGINRRSDFIAERDYIFLGDTIKTGSNISPFFNTHVASLGYMFSALTDPKAFLGFYFNLYLLLLETGIDSNIGSIDATLRLGVPLPNLGFLADYQILPWLIFKTKAGFFNLRVDNFGGRLYDFNIGLAFRPLDWLSLALSYQEFDVVVDFVERGLDTGVRYNFRGPSVGLIFSL